MPSILIWDPESGDLKSKIKRRCALILPLKSSSYIPSSPHHPPLHHLLLIVLCALLCAIVAFFGTFAVVDLYNRYAIERRFNAEAFCAAYGDCADCPEEISPDFRRYQQSYVAFLNRELERTQSLDVSSKCRRFLALHCAGVRYEAPEKVVNIPKVSQGDLITKDGLKSIVRKFCNFTVNPGLVTPKVQLCKKEDSLCDRCVRYNVDCLNTNPYYLMNPDAWTCNTPEEWSAIGYIPGSRKLEVPANCSTMMSELFDNSDNWNFDGPTSVKIDYDAVL